MRRTREGSKAASQGGQKLPQTFLVPSQQSREALARWQRAAAVKGCHMAVPDRYKDFDCWCVAHKAYHKQTAVSLGFGPQFAVRIPDF